MTTQITSFDLAALAKERRIAFVVWIAVSAITIASWLFAPSHEPGADHRSLLVAVVVFLGFLKSMFVAQYFMDVRHAPRWLQLSMHGWMAVLWLALLAIYFLF